MGWIPGGTFRMGSDHFYFEERPAREVSVSGFWIDSHPVTVADFRAFVDATGYVTSAERPLDAAAFPGVDPSLLVPGSVVFAPTSHPVDLRDFKLWWRYLPGASWRSPSGAASSTDGLDQHPVVHVAYEDALAYSMWAGKALPSEAEWERAARGGLDGTVYTWGDQPIPGGRHMANTWQGEFPWQNLLADGFFGTSPVCAFPANGFGLYDMAGNVWEWTEDFFRIPNATLPTSPCCAPRDPRVEEPDLRLFGAEPDAAVPRRVIKGGSHLCAPNYCFRYRPAARQAEAVDTSTAHIGFRCVVRPANGTA
ncbi:MAG TPA: formylglycine-generating enzyme family protein [Candidatus Dormibacteraeota bacterium]|nr:formylglycine-generating enzyme family protein [Candidatus Dormibacteraeota bacterium]